MAQDQLIWIPDEHYQMKQDCNLRQSSCSSNDSDIVYCVNPLLELRNNKSETVLLHAASEGRSDSVTFLINQGANVTAMDSDGNTFLMLMIKRTDGTNLGLFLNEQNKLLHVSQYDSGNDSITLRSAFEAVINAKNHDCETPLILAVRTKNTDLVTSLIDFNADLNACNDGEQTVLHEAVYNFTEPEILEALVLGGACVNGDPDFFGNGPLHVAVRRKSSEAADWLMFSGAVLRERNKDGQEVSDIAINNQMWAVVNRVMEAEKTKRANCRVAFEYYLIDRIECMDCLARFNECFEKLWKGAYHHFGAEKRLKEATG